MSSVWNNDTVLEFLELYRREQHLWDPKHPLHRNRSEVGEAWVRIQSSLGAHYSIVDLKKKKESLMTSFRMHFSKKKSQDGYRTTWFAFPLMESFLGGKYECDSTNQLDNEFFINTDNYITQPDHRVPDHQVNSINKSISVPDCKNIIIKEQKPMKTQIKSSQKDSLDSHYSYPNKQRTSESVNFSRNNNVMRNEMDEYDLYGQLLAKKLRKLDEHQRDLAMHDIDNVMFRAKMRSQPNQSRSYSSSPPPQGQRKIKSPIFIVAQQNPPEIAVQYETEDISYEEHAPS